MRLEVRKVTVKKGAAAGRNHQKPAKKTYHSGSRNNQARVRTVLPEAPEKSGIGSVELYNGKSLD